VSTHLPTPPKGPCRECSRTMVSRHDRRGIPEGCIAYGGHGLCTTCYRRHKKRCQSVAPPAPVLPPAPREIGGAEPWMGAALCAQADDFDKWFPNPSENAREAKAICRRCSVLNECARYALARPDLYWV